MNYITCPFTTLKYYTCKKFNGLLESLLDMLLVMAFHNVSGLRAVVSDVSFEILL